MKKLSMFALMIFLGSSSIAQITLNAATHGITAGAITPVWIADTTNFYAGSAGSGQTWDFSMLHVDSLSNGGSYIDPADFGSFYTSMFPTANFMTLGSMSSSDFFKQTSSEISLVGTYFFSTSTAMNYSDPEILQTFPFSYGNTITDPYHATYSAFTRNGTTTITADGEGTLILPWGSFAALRVKTMDHYVDFSSSGGFTADEVIYNWYTATEQSPVLQFAYGFIDPTSGPNQSFKSVTVNSNVVGIAENNLQVIAVNVFPNPVIDQCTISYTLKEAQPVIITICDILGRTIQTINKGVQQYGNKSETIIFDSLSKGIYIVKLQCGIYSGFKKIQVS